MITKPLHVLKFSFSASNIFLFFSFYSSRCPCLIFFPCSRCSCFSFCSSRCLCFSLLFWFMRCCFFLFSGSFFGLRVPNWSLCPFLYVRLVPGRFFGLAPPVFFSFFVLV